MYLIILLLFTLLYYLPIIINPNFLINRGNDLSEFFFPIFYFVKDSVFKFHQVPFWNNLFFSGTPLLPDPQSPLFYLPNIIFLFTASIDVGFLLTIFLHIFFAGISMFYLCSKGFNFNKLISISCACLYIASPKLSGFIEAGHYGLITSWTFIPLVFLFSIKFAEKPSIKNVILLSLFLSTIFYLHILIFLILIISVDFLIIFLLFKNKTFLKSIRYFVVFGLFLFGFCAVGFLPQISWQKETTRNLLLLNPDVYPKWFSLKEFVRTVILPLLNGYQYIQSLDTEKIISIGVFPTILSFIGFLQLRSRYKLLIIIISGVLLMISLNNSSPFYSFLLKQNWYILLRVSTRVWFLIIFIVIFTSGIGLQKLFNKEFKFLAYILIFLSILESLLVSWTKITKPIVKNQDLAPNTVYEFLAVDKTKFRVFCLNRCLSQKTAALYDLELADGYGTLQQKNYYEYSQQLSQSFYRNRYTLSIPPFEIYKYEILQPYSPNLSAYNIKYIISDHLLNDKNLKLVKEIDKYFIYENKINLERSNYPITFYSPNYIEINTSNFKDTNLVLSEVYNPDWKAYGNNKELKINESLDKTREVKIDSSIKSISFTYYPTSFKLGALFTSLITLISIYFLFFKSRFATKNKRVPPIKKK